MPAWATKSESGYGTLFFFATSVILFVFIGNNYKIARFVTAYELQSTENIIKILESPDWEKKA